MDPHQLTIVGGLLDLNWLSGSTPEDVSLAGSKAVSEVEELYFLRKWNENHFQKLKSLFNKNVHFQDSRKSGTYLKAKKEVMGD